MLAALHQNLPHLIHAYGIWVVASLIALESLGLPLPGETALISAAIYAGTTHRIGLAPLFVAATIGAILGGTAGFWIGRSAGYKLALRYGGYVGLTEPRLKLGQYLFLRHGGKIVFFGRFVAILRALASFLAGANRMPWPRFQLFNVTGALLWAGLYASGPYVLGHHVRRLAGPLGSATLVLVLVLIVAGFVVGRRHHAQIQAKAERALPGPLRP